MTTDEKIVQVVTRMINAPNEIEEVVDSGPEYYFKFHGHAFSITYRPTGGADGNHTFFIYPRWNGTSKRLAEQFEKDDFGNVKYTAFASARGPFGKLFEQLYQIVDSRANGVDDVLDSILDEPDF
jgi:hypothetical protein